MRFCDVGRWFIESKMNFKRTKHLWQGCRTVNIIVHAMSPGVMVGLNNRNLTQAIMMRPWRRSLQINALWTADHSTTGRFTSSYSSRRFQWAMLSWWQLAWTPQVIYWAFLQSIATKFIFCNGSKQVQMPSCTRPEPEMLKFNFKVGMVN